MDRICIDCGEHFEGQSRNVRCPKCRKIDHSHPIREKVCTRCGEPYTTRGSKSYYCPACARKQADAATIKSRANKNRRRLGSTDLCQRCGEPYIVAGGLQKFCPQCAIERKRQAALDAYYKSGKDTRRKLFESRAIATAACIICGKEFPLDGERFITCSEECAEINAQNLKQKFRENNAEHLKESFRAWETANREYRTQYQRERYRKKKAELEIKKRKEDSHDG